jgi:hypothetical protein
MDGRTMQKEQSALPDRLVIMEEHGPSCSQGQSEGVEINVRSLHLGNLQRTDAQTRKDTAKFLLI